MLRHKEACGNVLCAIADVVQVTEAGGAAEEAAQTSAAEEAAAADRVVSSNA